MLLCPQSVQASDIHHIEDLIPSYQARYEELHMQSSSQQCAHASLGPLRAWNQINLCRIAAMYRMQEHAPSLPCPAQQRHCHPWQMTALNAQVEDLLQMRLSSVACSEKRHYL